MYVFDVVVIGAGSGGLTAAVGLAKIGRSVLLIERDQIGGECTNSGCIPSKAFLYYAQSYHRAVKIAGHNDYTNEYQRGAFPYVRAKVAETRAHETAEHFKKIGITVKFGEAVFASKTSVTINHGVGSTEPNETYSFIHAIIATGSSPRLISVPGLREDDILTNQNFFALKDIPQRTLIIGGGPIGLEMGQALTRLGSQVTIIDNKATLAELEDPTVAHVLETTFAEQGIRFIGQANLTTIENKIAHITVANQAEPEHVPFDQVLVAIGRVPNFPTGLAMAHITTAATGIVVNHNYQTSNPRVFALGDVADTLKFTHQADDVARQVVWRIATYGLTSVATKAVPKVTYTEPELAQVGLTQAVAETTFGPLNIHRIVVPYGQNDRARMDNNTAGVLVVIVKRLTGEILGAHIAGPRAGELIAIFTLAIDQHLSLWRLGRTIYAYPTYALIIKKAADYFFVAQMTSLKTDLVRLFRRLMPKILLTTLWLIGLFFLYRYQAMHSMSVSDMALMVFDFITQTAIGPVLYILAYAVRPVTFLPGTALTVLSGVFFGLWGGIIYTIIGANLSATLAYGLGRYFSSPGVTTQKTLLRRFTDTCRSNPFTTILTMRLIFLPYDGVNYGAGLLKIPFVPYILATIMGTLLGIATFVSIGASLSVAEFRAGGLTLAAIDTKFLLLSLIIFVTSLVVSRSVQLLTRKK